MALKKTKEIAGYRYEYWMIYKSAFDRPSDKTVLRLALYKDEATRRASIEDYIQLQAVTMDGVDYKIKDLYEKVKESKMSEAQSVEGEKDYVAPAETNWFINAEDC